MGRLLVAFLALGTLLYPAYQKRNQPKPPDLEVVEAAAHRVADKITVDGRVRNVGEKPLQELKLLFDFLAPGRQVIVTLNGSIEEEVLERGRQAEFHVESAAPPRAVEVRISAQEGTGRELRLVKNGPFPID